MDLLHQLNFKKQIFFEKNKIFSILKYEIKYCSIRKELHDWRIVGIPTGSAVISLCRPPGQPGRGASQAFFYTCSPYKFMPECV